MLGFGDKRFGGAAGVGEGAGGGEGAEEVGGAALPRLAVLHEGRQHHCRRAFLDRLLVLLADVGLVRIEKLFVAVAEGQAVRAGDPLSPRGR